MDFRCLAGGVGTTERKKNGRGNASKDGRFHTLPPPKKDQFKKFFRNSSHPPPPSPSPPKKIARKICNAIQLHTFEKVFAPFH